MKPPPPEMAPTVEPLRRAHLASSFAHAFAGLAYAARTQPNMRFHLAAAVVVPSAAAVLHVPRPFVAAIVIMVALVLAFELLNTALEAVVDLMTSVHHPLAKAAKDAAAGAVLVVAFAALVVGYLTFAADGARLAGAQPGAPCYNGAGLSSDPSFPGDRARRTARAPAGSGRAATRP